MIRIAYSADALFLLEKCWVSGFYSPRTVYIVSMCYIRWALPRRAGRPAQDDVNWTASTYCRASSKNGCSAQVFRVCRRKARCMVCNERGDCWWVPQLSFIYAGTDMLRLHAQITGGVCTHTKLA